MESRSVSYECVVHKANLVLGKGESLGAYTSKLREAANAHIAKSLNLTPKNCSSYMVEAFADAAIFDVSKRPMVEGNPWTYALYAVKYTRKADGTFEFNDTTEVERVVSYQAKGPMSVTKAKKCDDGDEEFEDEELAKKPAKTKKEFAPGWVAAEKSVNWSGLL
jgi:hypothetical protein